MSLAERVFQIEIFTRPRANSSKAGTNQVVDLSY